MDNYALFANDIINGTIGEDTDTITCEDDGGCTKRASKTTARGPSPSPSPSSLTTATNKRRDKKTKPKSEIKSVPKSGGRSKKSDVHETGVCVDCNAKMMLSGNELVCQYCGTTAEYEEYDAEYATTSSIRVRVGTGYRTINNTTNSRKIQCDSITTNLIARQIECMNNGDACIPNEVLSAVAKVYNSIQNNIGRAGDSYVLVNPNKPLPEGVNKLVHRSKPRDTIMMAIIYHKLHEFGLYRGDKALKNFMQTSDGISKGETILRKMKAVFPGLDITFATTGKAVIPNITTKFLEALGVSYEGGSGVGHDVYCFVVDLVDRVIAETIGYQSQPTTKIAGSISIANELYGLGKTRAEIETACDNTKYSTYSRFIDEVYDPACIDALTDVFAAYGFDCEKPSAFIKTRTKKVATTSVAKKRDRTQKTVKCVD